ncbi:MAG: serine/threonine-protein kinase, partial [Isosphaeraceae bacterium]
MNTTTMGPDSSFPEPLERFERELMDASDPAAVLKRYREEFPDLADMLGKIAEAIAMLQVTPPGQGHFEPEPTLPERFGPYKVVRSIGRGGMGEVFEAIEEPLGRRVAIKTLRRHPTTPSLLRRFDRERRTLARLHHTNVVPIYATGSEGDLLYFAMPYLSGASLGQVIKTARSRELSGNGLTSSSFEELVNEAHSRSQSASEPPQKENTSASAAPAPVAARHLSREFIRSAVRVMAMVAEGLHHAHQAGFIHRDLKPGNVIVERDGHAWVLDFGLAAFRANAAEGPLAFAIPSDDSDLERSLTVGTLGTPGYMAAEQQADSKRANVQSDVWGLGVTLYELLTLQRAFPTNTAAIESKPTPPRELSP